MKCQYLLNTNININHYFQIMNWSYTEQTIEIIENYLTKINFLQIIHNLKQSKWNIMHMN